MISLKLYLVTENNTVKAYSKYKYVVKDYIQYINTEKQLKCKKIYIDDNEYKDFKSKYPQLELQYYESYTRSNNYVKTKVNFVCTMFDYYMIDDTLDQYKYEGVFHFVNHPSYIFKDKYKYYLDKLCFGKVYSESEKCVRSVDYFDKHIVSGYIDYINRMKG